MSPEIRAQLLASMHADRLVVVCGAGLSMAAPSNLPSAWRVAENCFDNYQMNVDPDVDLNLRHDLEALAQHFVEVLSAMRQGGRQIICAVEDEALAELICRRLLRTSDEIGLHHKIDVDANSSGSVVETTQIPNMPNSVLRRASDQFHSA